MSKITLTQFSFNRGELAPALHGRSDWKYYFSGAEKLRNLIARPQGGAVKRGGLRLVAPALDDARPSHLIPFRFSVKQSYMLEFGHHSMRVIKDGGLVLHPEGHELAGQPIVVQTPYPAEALPALRYCQTADVMIFTHPDHPPRRLARHAHHIWEFSFLLNNQSTGAPQGLRVVESGGGNTRYVVTAVHTGVESPPSAAAVALIPGGIENPGDLSFSELYNWLKERDYSRVPSGLAFHSMSPQQMINFLVSCGYANLGVNTNKEGYHWRFRRPGASHDSTLSYWPTDYWYLYHECLYACDQDWAGNAKAALAAQIDKYVDDYNGKIPVSGVTELVWEPVENATSYRVYREDRDLEIFRPIGVTATPAFTDDNLPDLLGALPAETDLFSTMDDYPGVCAFFEQRLVLGRTNNKPTTFWGSDTGTYNSFSKHSPVEDADSYEFTLSSGEMNEIHWIVPLNDMLLGTSGGEWKAGGGGYAITPSNINARLQSWYGCANIRPVVVGRTVIFVGRSRRTLRNFSYSLEADGYAGQDLSAYASHLFAGRTVVDMCHQQEPSGIVWAVMSDGALLSCTYAPEEDVVAWSRHETRGRFESCGSLVDVDGSDQVYFCVERSIGGRTHRFIETLDRAADAVSDPAEGFFLDCGLTYRGTEVGAVSGLEHLEGERVVCLADGNVFTDLPVEGGRVELPDGFAASVIHAGLPYEAELVTLELEPEAKETLRNRARFAVSAAVRLSATRECLYSHSDGALSEMKFRTTEVPGRAVRLFTGEKNIVFSSPPGARTTRLRFLSQSPTPFTLLGIIAEASCGQPA